AGSLVVARSVRPPEYRRVSGPRTFYLTATLGFPRMAHASRSRITARLGNARKSAISWGFLLWTTLSNRATASNAHQSHRAFQLRAEDFKGSPHSGALI